MTLLGFIALFERMLLETTLDRFPVDANKTQLLLNDTSNSECSKPPSVLVGVHKSDKHGDAQLS
jgi:hypothetical protein